jgi:hypothetical protein
MSTSVFLARLIGPVMVVIGVAFLTDRAGFRAMLEEMLASRPLIFVAGVAPLAIGLSIVLSHNVWTADWRIVLTLFGWLAILVGAYRILFPAVVARDGAALVAKPAALPTAAAILLVLGGLFCFFGYFR